jgi:hypothetical protein
MDGNNRNNSIDRNGSITENNSKDNEKTIDGAGIRNQFPLLRNTEEGKSALEMIVWGSPSLNSSSHLPCR